MNNSYLNHSNNQKISYEQRFFDIVNSFKNGVDIDSIKYHGNVDESNNVDFFSISIKAVNGYNYYSFELTNYSIHSNNDPLNFINRVQKLFNQLNIQKNILADIYKCYSPYYSMSEEELSKTFPIH